MRNVLEFTLWLLVIFAGSTGIASALTGRYQLLQQNQELMQYATPYEEGRHCVIYPQPNGGGVEICQDMGSVPTGKANMILDCTADYINDVPVITCKQKGLHTKKPNLQDETGAFYPPVNPSLDLCVPSDTVYSDSPSLTDACFWYPHEKEAPKGKKF